MRLRLFNSAFPMELDLEISPPFTAKDLLNHVYTHLLSNDPGALSISTDRENLLVIINGIPIQQLQGWETLLRPVDEVSILPMMGGG